MKRICFLIDDAYLLRKVRFEIPFAFEPCDGEAGADVIIREGHTSDGRCIEIEANGALTVLDLPLPLGEIKKAFMPRGGAKRLTLASAGRAALLDGERIELTELEYSLLSLLISEGGFVSKEKILSAVFAGATDAGIVNVYIHYLRSKLEAEGEKIILTSRGRGYSINEKYVKEGN